MKKILSLAVCLIFIGTILMSCWSAGIPDQPLANNPSTANQPTTPLPTNNPSTTNQPTTPPPTNNPSTTNQPTTPPPTMDLSWYDRFGVTAEEVAAQHKKYGKRTCEATIDNAFAAGRVLVLVYPFANDYTYSSSDFEDVGCVAVKDLTPSLINPDNVSRILMLTLDSDTKQAVLDAIAVLQKREDVYCAQPDYQYSIYD